MTKLTFSREAAIFKALANRKRLEIVQLLHQGELSATEIQRMTAFPQANLSQHLAALKAAQIVVAVRSGKSIRFRLAHPIFWQVSHLLEKSQISQCAKKHESNHTQVQDPVCGMWVEPAAAKWRELYKGATYFFCASGCERRFHRAPHRYVGR